MYAIHRNGYWFQIKLYIQQIQNIDLGVLYVGMMKP